MSALHRLGEAVVRYCLRPLGNALMTVGGIDMHLPGRREVSMAGYRELGYAPPVLPLPYGPPADHPERLRPDVPLTGQERALLQEFAASGRTRQTAWNATGGRR